MTSSCRIGSNETNSGDLTVTGMAIVAAVFAGYALVALKLERWWISAPMLFTATGFLLGPSALNVLPFRIGDELALTAAEVSLALLLFADASTVKLREVEGDARLPQRLLLIGLPITIVLGTLVAGLMFPGIGWAAAAVIATILAPTDAALGLAVFTNVAVPVRIRRALNVESGLNDGLAMPFLTLFLAVLASEEGSQQGSWLIHAADEIALAFVAALVVGVGGAWLLSRRTPAVGHPPRRAAGAPVPRAPFLRRRGGDRRERVRGAFTAGIFFGATTRNRMHRSIEFTETLALFLTFAVWSVFGALLVGPVITGGISVEPIAYAVVSLTLIRMIPVAISWTGLRLRPRTVLFAGWFGPRGLASVVFTMLTIQTLHDTGVAADTIVQVATWTSCSRSSRTASRPRRSHEVTDVGSQRRLDRFPNSRTFPSRASDDAA